MARSRLPSSLVRALAWEATAEGYAIALGYQAPYRENLDREIAVLMSIIGRSRIITSIITSIWR
jgi:hypothetical protein